MCSLRVLTLLIVICITTCLAIPFADPRLPVPSSLFEDVKFEGEMALPDKNRRMQKRRWLFPTQNNQNSKALAALYPTGDCGDEFGNMLNQFRRLPRGKGRDDMIAAMFTYCTGRAV